jgi:hypothetical protein
VILVVDQSDRDAARLRGTDRVGDAVADRPRKPNVVERQLQRAARVVNEPDDPVGDVLGPLTAVDQLVEREMLD